MVKFTQKLDRNNKIYVVKPLRQAGFVNTIEIVPNAKAAVMYQTGTRIDDVLSSLKIITADLKQQAKREAEKGVVNNE
jgi:hypothetical protein